MLEPINLDAAAAIRIIARARHEYASHSGLKVLRTDCTVDTLNFEKEIAEIDAAIDTTRFVIEPL